jgi:wyosine [tRNA(Phe)-imidazoG37] synthetase (radical SAM superfamily)
VPSRRLGRSLGINNIPPKICSYSCLYCQVGPTIDRSIEPRAFYPPQQVTEEVAAQVNQVQARGETIDYLTFVPDGEPSLDIGLGECIRLLKPLGIKIAVISNGTLLWRQDVREALLTTDWVSVKVDAATEPIWRRVNRPHPQLDFATVQEGIRRFVGDFEGDSVSETMLVDGVNDAPESVTGVGEFLRDAGIGKAYLAIPTRPTPYPAITAPGEESVNRAYQLLSEHVPQVEYLIGYEGDEFASSVDPRRDLLSITAVHPMRASAVRELLARTDAGWKIVEDLVADGSLTEVAYGGQLFYVRQFAS